MSFKKATNANKAKKAKGAKKTKEQIYNHYLFGFFCLSGLIGVFGLALASPAVAAEIHLQLSQPRVNLGEATELQITVTGEGNFAKPKIQIPNGLSVHSQSESQRIEIVNWQTKRSLTYTLLLVPSQPGIFALGPAILDAGGQFIQSNKETLEVSNQKSTQVPGTPQGLMHPFAQPKFPRTAQEMLEERGPQSQQETAKSKPSAPSATSAGQAPAFAFLDTKISKKEGFVGEPIPFSVLFFTRVPFVSQPQYTPPPLTGFWKEDLPQKTYQADAGGVTYSVTEIPMILFPQTPGELHIGPAKVKVEMEARNPDIPMDPFDPQFLQRFFSSGQLEAKVLQTKKLSFHASALLEENKPKNFTGAVGKYAIDAQVDKKELKVGETATLTIKISGEGNIKGLPGPIYPNLEGTFRSYETEKTETVSTAEGKIKGEKIFKLLLIPQVPGNPDLTIAPIAFNYFDPESKSYARIETPPITLKVSGEALAQASTNAQGAPEAKKLADDIDYIETDIDQGLNSKFFVSAAGRSWPWTGSLPLLLWASTLLARFTQKRRASRRAAPLEQFQRATLEAQKFLAQGHQGKAIEILSNGLESAAAKILKLPAAEIKIKTILEAVGEKLSSDELTRLKEILENLQFLRFAPTKTASKNEIKDLMERVGEIKKILEKLST